MLGVGRALALAAAAMLEQELDPGLAALPHRADQEFAHECQAGIAEQQADAHAAGARRARGVVHFVLEGDDGRVDPLAHVGIAPWIAVHHLLQARTDLVFTHGKDGLTAGDTKGFG